MAWYHRLFGSKETKTTLKEAYNYLSGTPAPGTLDFWNSRPDQDGFLPLGFYRKRSHLGDNPQAFLNTEQLRMARE
ncbi:hypothetical protein ABFV62_30995, partial [Pseudomonas syringae]|uniref:hypothetical protein n=1 Tax=Pseudomonas syringae TaxID=317 RepID=UPI0034D6BFE0